MRFVYTAARVAMALPLLFVVFICFLWGFCSGDK